MRKDWKVFWLLACVAGLALMLPACSDDDDPTDPGGGGGGDTTAPQVASIVPDDGDMMVDVAGDIVITFNEAMDTGSAAGQITLSQGTVSNLAWTNDRTLSVEHSAWPQATNVTVTVGTGLADAAGNNLATQVAASFWTFAEASQVLDSDPADGATGINRSASIDLLFSEPMNAASLQTGVTINDDTKVLRPFTVEVIDQYRYELEPNEPLAPNSVHTVTIGAGVQTADGSSLQQVTSFSFTTSSVIDDTPPTIVSFDPASGSTMPTSQQYLTIVFSEPMDTENFSPSMMNGQFAYLISETLGGISWNGDNSELMVPLPTPLPEGLPLLVKFAGYADANGNVQSAETVWECTIAGTADNYPVWDGRRFAMMGTWEEGEPGNQDPYAWGDEMIFYEFGERGAANQWDRREFYDPDYMSLDTYEIEEVTAAGVDLVGFEEETEGKRKAEFFLSNPVTLVEFPFVKNNTWSGTATVTMPDGTYTASLTGIVQEMEDLPLGGIGGDVSIVWTDVWRVQTDLTVSMGSTTISEQTTVRWFAPGIGIIRDDYYSDDLYPPEETGWHSYERWLYLNLD